ncbi:MAG: PH domain-containing protein [Candidatus Hermodarchaeota archaeon]
MSDITQKVKVIRGEGRFPPPTVRKIYPTRALLWKFYFTTFVVWILVGIGLFLAIQMLSFMDNLDSSDGFPPELLDLTWLLFWVGSILIIPIVLIILPFYVKSMEYTVHGDEVVVAKGLINRTVKYCPFRTVTNISTRAGLFDRLFGIGCVFVQTAGKSGQQTGPEERLEGLRLYHEIRDYILKQLRAYSHPSESESITQEGVIDKQILYQEYVTELREIKQILKEKKR